MALSSLGHGASTLISASLSRLACVGAHALATSSAPAAAAIGGIGASTSGAAAGGSVLPRSLDTGSDAYAASLAKMNDMLDAMRAAMAGVHAAGGEAAIKRHRARGKLLPRERIDMLLDEGSPFLELSPLAGHHMYGAFRLVWGGRQLTSLSL
jgi:3-methylcrotonyl-CoA carboxylase beta subunit